MTTLQEMPLHLESDSHAAFAFALAFLPEYFALLLPGQAMWFFLGPQPDPQGFSAATMAMVQDWYQNQHVPIGCNA